MYWSRPLLSLAGKGKVSQSLLKLSESNIHNLKELVWIFPLRIQKAPSLASFDAILADELFFGSGEIIQTSFAPSFGKRGKRNIQLLNVSCVVKDQVSKKTLELKWFNAYPTLRKQLQQFSHISFLGKVSEFRGVFQIINPKINPPLMTNSAKMLIEYPTINTVSGKNVQKVIQKIDAEVWARPLSILTAKMEQNLKLCSLNNALLIIHGKKMSTPEQLESAKNRLIYEEFLENQLKVFARKLKNKKLSAPAVTISQSKQSNLFSIFPYQLTTDQKMVFKHILYDLSSGKPMMRMIQGDVGCGKTSVAILAALTVINQGLQVALMCPTEALADQHFKTIGALLDDKISSTLLLGNTRPKEKRCISEDLKTGKIDLIIGTHSLIQDNIEFKRLGLAIIDEQHKFGVVQRQKLAHKGKEATHTLIMTATPIPRSLQLAQYGDLDISTIRVMPQGRKGTKTRIVTPQTYESYLSFLKTRMSLKEQVYVVVPAIEESDALNLNNIQKQFESYRRFFPEHKIAILHGKLDTKEKQSVMHSYARGEIEILISTTVIEVGINVINSTVISIYNPERFGLSSLHQLRGRVGRGDKPGFCFLITDDNTSQESLKRLKIIEKTNDGFEIAEADLKNRGQGDLFGSSQSGHISNYRLANIVKHYKIFQKVAADIEQIKINDTEYINQVLLDLIDKDEVSSTI